MMHTNVLRWALGVGAGTVAARVHRRAPFVHRLLSWPQGQARGRWSRTGFGTGTEPCARAMGEHCRSGAERGASMNAGALMEPMAGSPMDRLGTRLVALPRSAKRALVVCIDALLCLLSFWLSMCVYQDGCATMTRPGWCAAAASLAIALPLFARGGLYNAIFRYSGGPAMAALLRVLALYGLVYAVMFTLLGVEGVPRSIGILQPTLLLAGVAGSRLLARAWLGRVDLPRVGGSAASRVLIYGAGEAGCQLAQALAHSPKMRVMGFLDDDPHLQGGLMNGLPIFDPARLDATVRELQVNEVLLALPSASNQRRTEILDTMRRAHVAVRTLPALLELAHGEASTGVRELDIDDLLGRAAVPPDAALLSARLTGKVVLVTGAGGSIGSELCRQILHAAPAILLLVEHSEYALYAIHGELESLARRMQGNSGEAALRIVPLLASVGDERRIDQIMSAWHPHTVYHAAAYKHVPLVEHNATDGIRNNVFGTLVAARAAAEHGVSDFVLVSTDKAVRPTNIMGASKRIAEMVLQALAKEMARNVAGTRFSMVRFGNVLDSSGSVVPLFRKQIAEGGPITLTHPDMTRYFMTISEAAQLVIQAGAMAVGGEVFVLDMGAPMRVGDLARRMVELSGKRVREAEYPAGDIEIRIVGLRPGEKLYEELLIGDNPQVTLHPRILKAHDECLPWPELSRHLQRLSLALQSNDVQCVRDELETLVKGYRPYADVVDWVHMAQRTLPKLPEQESAGKSQLLGARLLADCAAVVVGQSDMGHTQLQMVGRCAREPQAESDLAEDAERYYPPHLDQTSALEVPA